MKDFTKNGAGVFANSLAATGNFDFISDGANTPLSRTEWFNYSQQEVVDHGRIAECQAAILDALHNTMYAAIICSTAEGVQACVSLGLPKIMPVYYRTHNSHVVYGTKGSGVGKAHNVLFNAYATGIRILANCPYTASLLTARYGVPCDTLYNPLELADCQKSDKPKGYLLIIARYDKVKRPELTIKIAELTGLPVYVMTGSVVQKRCWDKLIAKSSIQHSKVVFGIKGVEKDRVLQGASASLSCAIVESFGNNIMETATYCPTFIVEQKHTWSRNFEELPFAEHLNVFSDKTPIEEIAEAIKVQSSQEYPLRNDNALRRRIYKRDINAFRNFHKSAKLDASDCTDRSNMYSDLVKNGSFAWSSEPLKERLIKNMQACRTLLNADSKGNMLVIQSVNKK